MYVCLNVCVNMYIYTYIFNILTIDVSVLVSGQGPHVQLNKYFFFPFLLFLKLDVHVFFQEAQSRETLLLSVSLECVSS